ncbi:MAG: cysteine desulfurase family protein [Eubacterium sp.]|nr:cysteine desulfurase family protein [Eubacterium sp.]
MIYLDNAATSFPKPETVFSSMEKCIRNYCANPGRGSHYMSVQSALAVNDTREKIASLLKIKDSLNICFTKNATEALNIAILGSLKEGDHVITTCMEHNSVLRPLKTMEKYSGIKLTIVDADGQGRIDPFIIKRHINRKTKLIACTLSSNVNGIILPVREIGKIAADKEIMFLLDASQGVGSIEVDLERIPASMLAFPGHKGLLGPQGTGGLYTAPGIRLNPLMSGGTGSRSEYLFQPDFLPDRFESGTLNTPGIVGLGAGIDFINKTGLSVIKTKKDELVKRLYDGLSQNKKIRVFSPPNVKENSGIIAFTVKDTDSTEVSTYLDRKYNIECRAGQHCAPLVHKHFNTSRTGMVRLSVGYFNTVSEIETTISAINRLVYEKTK